MEQYISKSALVAELEELEEKYKSDWDFDEFVEGYKSALEDILPFIYTLNVKEVNLEKEIDTIVDAVPCRREHLEFIAKHFFELGLQAQKGE